MNWQQNPTILTINPEDHGMDSGDVIYEAAKLLKEGRGIRIDKDLAIGNLKIVKFEVAELLQLDSDEQKCHAVMLNIRPGVACFCSHLEYTFFPPEQPCNDLYEFRFFCWRGHLWRIVSIPIKNQHLFGVSAQESKPKLKVQHAVPFVVGIVVASIRPSEFHSISNVCGDLAEQFPMRSESVYTLENGEKRQNGPLCTTEDSQAEMAALKEIYSKSEDLQDRN